jgi:inorganic pyrophosphatase
MPVRWLCWVLLPLAIAAQERTEISNELPIVAVAQLAKSLSASSQHTRHVWRDTPPFNEDGTVSAYVEIARGDRRKWEFDMSANQRAIDRMIPAEIGGYPVNYGFVPQTVSYDGDPFDALVLGPPIDGGRLVRGAIVGLLIMEDEKGPDSKVVLSPDSNGGTRAELSEHTRQEIADYFRRYKRLEPDKFSTVAGWGSIADGRTLVSTTHAFFVQCRQPSISSCRVAR